MIFNKKEYFKRHGFKEDPFASTNAIHEEFLDKYFITPPYFYSLIGSLDRPKSSFVIAPRGTGKTAQRRMLEKISQNEKELLTIVYDNFPLEGITNVKDIKLEEHLVRINKYLIIALLTELNEREIEKSLDSYEKGNLKKLIEIYLNGISTSEVEDAIKAIKGVTGKVSDLWRNAGKSINSVVNAILATQGISSVDLNFSKKAKLNLSYDEIGSHISFVEELFNNIGVKSLFVLVDSIDETSLTGNDSKNSYELIKPFVKDLRMLERKTIVFKFFVWDKIEEHWSEDMRKDRIETFSIKWNSEEIIKLMQARLNAYSDGVIDSLESILDCSEEIINLIYIFANNSPRDLINIMKNIFDTHLRIVDDLNSIPTTETVIKGIQEFCKDKFEEVITSDKQRRELKRIKLSTFTIPHLSSEVFKCDSGITRNKLMPWTRAGIVYSSPNKIRVSKSRNAINIYTFSDLRIAAHVCSNQKLNEFIERNLIICDECSTINVFDKQNTYSVKEWQCKECLSSLEIK
ncbi:P-loop ATPase, Sll1717 family [Clostridium beijerinckii]|uniref:P-loop ATPase, Sll1717 family n=1 Tax=Clostridium beijerinckii TaxID=1520 RepID=UPI0002F69D40|nr:hypothetical protein [Clostridium beijerinckii]